MVVLIFMLVALGAMGLWGWSLADLLGRPEHQWRAIGQDRTLWVLAIMLLGLPGSIGYLAFVRPKLAQVPAFPPMAGYPMIAAAPPGWYPDPQGMPMMRWFDGRQWTPQTAAMGSVPMGGVPGGMSGHGYAQGAPMVVPMAGPPPGAHHQPQPHRYPPA